MIFSRKAMLLYIIKQKLAMKSKRNNPISKYVPLSLGIPIISRVICVNTSAVP